MQLPGQLGRGHAEFCQLAGQNFARMDRIDGSLLGHDSFSSVIISDLDVERRWGSVRPLEADAPLPVDTNAKLALAVAAQRFEMVAWQQRQAVPRHGVEQDPQAFLRLLFEGLE